MIVHTALELADRIFRRDAGALRQHADADEIVRKQAADPVDQVVAGDSPGFAGRGVAEMMPHAGRARRKDRQIRAAFALHLELAVDDRIADLVVADRRPRRRRRTLAMRVNLRLSPLFVLLGGRGVVAVAVDAAFQRMNATLQKTSTGVGALPTRARGVAP